MNEKLFEILAKYFSGEATETERNVVEKYKQEHKKEYEKLFELWNRKDIELFDFNKKNAWKKIAQRINKKPAKIIPFYSKMLRVASIAAILLILVSVYYYSDIFHKTEQVVLLSEHQGQNIKLPDGSKIWLNKGAKLSYPAKFDDKKRIVELDGEAFFKIERNEKKPFLVKMSNAVVEVLGTSFNINTNDETTKVIVAGGTVKVSNLEATQNIIITKGYAVEVKGNQVIKQKNKHANYLSWKTGEFSFKNSDLIQVVNDLNTYYDNRIEIDKHKNYECQLTAEFNKEKLQDIMDIIALTCSVNIKKKNNKFTIE